MPYKVVQDGEKWCVEKEGGERMGCHDSESEADAHMRAIYAEENKELSEAVDALKESIAPDAISEPDMEDIVGESDEKPADKALFERIWSRIEERLPDFMTGAKDADLTGFKVAGNHWLAVWSNNFRDREGEIFTAKAMSDYVSRVDMGITPLPELWVWHGGAKTAIGSADHVGMHGHFLLAAGQFYGSDAAQHAKAYYAKNARRTGISHGYTYSSDKFDGKHYHAFNTFEISLLPRGAEANYFTSLEGVKAMVLDEKKQDYYKQVFGEEQFNKIIADLDKRGKALEELGVEFKDFTTPDGDAEETASNKEAVEQASKDFADLISDLVATSAEPVLAATEALKAVKALEADNAQMRKELDELRAEMQLRPRVASKDAATVVEKSDLSEKMQKALDEQQVTIDPFWSTRVNTNGNHGA